MNEDEKQKELEEIAGQVNECQRCPLYRGANRAVPGEGSPDAKIMFIGEGPGYWEDQRGIPFCGAAGALLDKLLQSIKVERKSVFIGNVVKHRPPGNRDPLPEEIAACSEWLDRQIGIIQPKIIVTLGRFSMAKFIPEGKISQIHGQPRFIEFEGEKYIVIPMFHPAAALRSLEIMGKIKEDFSKIPELLKENKDQDIMRAQERPESPKEEQLSLLQ
ncbi:uracil-DNA glycosylase [Candidatus Shapirobacteria bacterium]|nr:uracil-DNA glycosylase [Candidatus Shapirobacteria bacterium]